MVGLENSEVKKIVSDFGLEQKVNIELLEEWYNSYRFNIKSSSIYNTDMVLYFVKNYLAENELPTEMIDINVRSDYTKLKSIIYTNKKLNGNFKALQTLIGGESVSVSNFRK